MYVTENSFVVYNYQNYVQYLEHNWRGSLIMKIFKTYAIVHFVSSGSAGALLDGFERHLSTLGSWNFSFLITGG
jgi:hypothetical protein